MDTADAAVISIASVAIQRALQVVDPMIDCIVDMTKDWACVFSFDDKEEK